MSTEELKTLKELIETLKEELYTEIDEIELLYDIINRLRQQIQIQKIKLIEYKARLKNSLEDNSRLMYLLDKKNNVK
jgi:dsRNA-specific ribonuclease